MSPPSTLFQVILALLLVTPVAPSRLSSSSASRVPVLARAATGAASARAAAPDILARSRAIYAALHTYADTGAVEIQYGSPESPVRERHTFRTYYRAPRFFFFDFRKQGNADQFVVWSDADAFHSWWRTTGVQQDFPKGRGASAFTSGSYPTSGALPQIMSILLPNARIVSTLTELGEVSEVGTELVDGRPCHKLVGIAQSTYGATGHVVNVRRTTVWIDAETLLIRKVFEDTPRGRGIGSVSRVTTTFRPHANPTLDDSAFQFTPPSMPNGDS